MNFGQHINRFLLPALPLFLLLTANSFGQSAYKCKDAQGKIAYSDVPCSSAEGGKVPLSATPSSASGAEFKLGQICVEQLRRFVTFKDPESIKILAQPRRIGAELIDWNGIRVEATQFSLIVDAKNSYGAYSGGEDYVCNTSIDGRRVLSIHRR